MLHVVIEITQTAAMLIGSLGAFWGLVRVVPKWLDHARMMNELTTSLERERTSEEAARNYRLAAESWQARFEALDGALSEIRAEQAQTKAELAAAVIYIVDLIVHFNRGGVATAMPEMPDLLKTTIHNALDRYETT